MEAETRTRTPSPWSLCGPVDNPCQCGYVFGDNGEVYIAQVLNPRNVEDGMPDPHPTISTAAANAAFIVRACNSHDDLLAALQSIAVVANELRDGEYCTAHQVVVAAQNAIAKAEGVMP